MTRSYPLVFAQTCRSQARVRAWCTNVPRGEQFPGGAGNRTGAKAEVGGGAVGDADAVVGELADLAVVQHAAVREPAILPVPPHLPAPTPAPPRGPPHSSTSAD